MFANEDMYLALSANSVIDWKNMFDFVTQHGVRSGIDDKRCAIDMAIIRCCLRRLEVTCDVLRACVRASAYQLADELLTLQRAPKEREARFLTTKGSSS